MKSAIYHATHDHTGEMVAAVNDMTAIDHLTPEMLKKYLVQHEAETSLIVFDANISVGCMKELCDFASSKNIPGKDFPSPNPHQ